MTEHQDGKKIFRFDLSFYYQSTIIYFVALLMYAIVKGEFIEESFTVIIRDPVLYFFVLIVLISVISLLYNISLKRHLEITDSAIIFKKGSKTRAINFADILEIKLSRERRRKKTNAFSMIVIRTKKRRLPVAIRPHDYYDRVRLIEAIKEIKNKLGK